MLYLFSLAQLENFLAQGNFSHQSTAAWAGLADARIKIHESYPNMQLEI